MLHMGGLQHQVYNQQGVADFKGKYYLDVKLPTSFENKPFAVIAIDGVVDSVTKYVGNEDVRWNIDASSKSSVQLLTSLTSTSAIAYITIGR